MRLFVLFCLLLMATSALAQTAEERRLRAQRALMQRRIQMQNNPDGNGFTRVNHRIERSAIQNSVARTQPVQKPRLPDGRLVETVDSMGLRMVDKLDIPTNAEKTMFFVFGPESSGNRYAVDILSRGAGCVGKSGHTQPYDVFNKGGRDTMTADDWARINFEELDKSPSICGVMHRSLPHHRKYPNIVSMLKQTVEHGYKPFIIITLRSEPEMIMSQKKQGHVSTLEQGNGNVHDGLRVVFDAIARTGVEFEVLTYENMGNPAFIRWIYRELGLGEVSEDHPVFRIQNEKHDFTDFTLLPNIAEPLPEPSKKALEIGPAMSGKKPAQQTNRVPNPVRTMPAQTTPRPQPANPAIQEDKLVERNEVAAETPSSPQHVSGFTDAKRRRARLIAEKRNQLKG